MFLCWKEGWEEPLLVWLGASGGGAEARGGEGAANEGGVAKRTANLLSLYYMEYADRSGQLQILAHLALSRGV